MAGNLQIVFSHLPEGVTDEEFSEWYDAHLPEILSIPGFVSAQRYRLEPVVRDAIEPVELPLPRALRDRGRHRHAAGRDGEAAARHCRHLRRAQGTGRSSGPPLPGVVDRARFASWNASRSASA